MSHCCAKNERLTARLLHRFLLWSKWPKWSFGAIVGFTMRRVLVKNRRLFRVLSRATKMAVWPIFRVSRRHIAASSRLKHHFGLGKWTSKTASLSQEIGIGYCNIVRYIGIKTRIKLRLFEVNFGSLCHAKSFELAENCHKYRGIFSWLNGEISHKMLQIIIIVC